MRTHVDFGIDLGTTNSTPAVIDGTKAKVITNKRGSSITPSAVWIDKRGAIQVGLDAKQRALTDKNEGPNADIEFKQRMGLGRDGGKHFARSGRDMLPEELSAEVLKELRRDIRTFCGEEIRAVVITVPANFGLDQSNATVKAAQLAGFEYSPLLLEPVAASLAYGFQSQASNEYWMVYDFGGGTFDAAIMQIRHGQINVFNHAGDNKLGGKNIDWDIVTELLVPEIAKRAGMSDFKLGTPKWDGAMGKLKWEAELAKIEVCRTREPYEIMIENLYTDSDGNGVDFAFTLTPEHVRKVSEPYIVRSLGLCQQALSEKGMTGRDMAKIIMVGGSTLNPWVRERVAEALGAPLEFSIDPVTVVAQGAAIFASTKKIPNIENDVPQGTWAARLVYDVTGRDLEPPISGKIMPPQDSGLTTDGYTLEFVDVVSSWRSGKIRLTADGEFDTHLVAEEGRRCEYRLELCDPRGTMMTIAPDACPYTHGVSVGDNAIIAPHTIAVGLADNTVQVYVPRGATLPLEGDSVDFKATRTVRAKSNDTLRIPLLQGHNPRADRNIEVAAMVLSGMDLERTLPEGSDVEVRIHMDENQVVTMEAFFRQIEHMQEMTVELGRKAYTVQELQMRFDRYTKRINEARASKNSSPELRAALAKIDAEDIVGQCQRMLQSAQHDVGVRTTLNERLFQLATMLDEVDAALAWPEKVKEAEEAKEECRRIVKEYGKAQHRDILDRIETELAEAVSSREPAMLDTSIRQVWRFIVEVAYGNVVFLERRLNALEQADKDGKTSDSTRAKQLIGQGRRAVQNGDLELMRSSVFQLEDLLRSGVSVEANDPGQRISDVRRF